MPEHEAAPVRRGALAILWVAAAIAVLTVLFLAPYVWIVSSSFKSQFAIFSDLSPLSWKTFWPRHPTHANFDLLFSQRHVGRALINSAVVAMCQVACTLLLCSMAAFGLTKVRFRGAHVIFTAILLTFLLPVEALVVPLYRVVSGLGLQDTLTGAWIPWVASPFGLFLLRQAFEEFPREYDDAARIDGAGHIRIFFSIVLPNMVTPLVTLALVTFLFSWNAFLWPLVIISSPENQLIQVAIAQSATPGELPDWGQTFAGVTVASVPLVLLFLILQRFFIRGMVSSGVKG
jgi:multiple sugar transport system permease protein/putative chitobiose transport system permease protein